MPRRRSAWTRREWRSTRSSSSRRRREPALPGQDPAPLLTGVTRGTLTARGTLEDPIVDLDATVHGLGSARTAAVGDVSVRYRYREALSVLEADLLSGG